MATFDITTYHLWQLSEKTAVSTPSHQRVQDPFILRPSWNSQGRKTDQRRARKGWRSRYTNTYSTHQSGCLPPCRKPLPWTSSWGAGELSGGPSCWRQVRQAEHGSRWWPESRVATPSLQPQSGTPHPPLLKEALFIGMWGALVTFLHQNVNSTA